jgi:hypothetical protein
MRERRLAKVVVTQELLIELLKQDFVVPVTKTTKGIPPDAVFLYSYTDDRAAQSFFVFEHPSFDAVELGSEIPIIRVEFTRYYGMAAIQLLIESVEKDA